MTLGEKFGEVYIGRGTFEDECEKIADDYAIDFLKWAANISLARISDDEWYSAGLYYFGLTDKFTSKQILEQFKKEKELL